MLNPHNTKFSNILKNFLFEVLKLNKSYLIDLGLAIKLKTDLVCVFTIIFIKNMPQQVINNNFFLYKVNLGCQ